MDVWVRCRVEVRRTEDGEIEQVEIKVSAHTARDTVPHTHSTARDTVPHTHCTARHGATHTQHCTAVPHTHSTAPSTRSVILARSILPDA